MITTEQARLLLDKYFAGDSSLAEEQALRQYYTLSEQQPTDLAPYAALFQFFTEEAKLSTSADLDDKLAQPPLPRMRKLSSWWAIAAAIALLLAVTAAWWQQPDSPLASTKDTIDWSQYEVEDPAEALRITHSALRRTSVALQHSTRRAAEEVRQVRKILPNLK